jgi:hypothetical protein
VWDSSRIPAGTAVRVRSTAISAFLTTAMQGERPDWPTLPAGTTVQVRSGGDRFLVDLMAANGASAERVLQAALAYKPRK